MSQPPRGWRVRSAVWNVCGTSNRVSNIGSLTASYDAAGNMTGDGTHTYQWDAEDRLVSMDSGSTATYKYNALGQRVERFLPNGSWTFDYLFGVGGEDLGVYSAGTAAWFDQDISMGGRILVDYGSPTRILHVNNLGTTTVTNDQTGAELQDELFYPWGQDWTRAGQPYVMRFAGMGFESPDQLYLTDFRKYNSALGRWMSPDPLGGDVTNPQSLNRYGYVLNNPTTLTDPSGLGPCDPFDPLDCGPPCDAFDPEGCQNGCNPVWADSCVLYCYYLGTCNGRNGGGGGGSSGGAGGGAPAPPSAPPAGQPPLRGGGTLGNQWVSNAASYPCLGAGVGTGSAPCFVILVQTSDVYFPNTPFGYSGREGIIVPPGTTVITSHPKPQPPLKLPPATPLQKVIMTGSCAMSPELYPPLNGSEKTHPDPGEDAERSVPGPRDPEVEGGVGLLRLFSNASRCRTEGRIP